MVFLAHSFACHPRAGADGDSEDEATESADNESDASSSSGGTDVHEDLPGPCTEPPELGEPTRTLWSQIFDRSSYEPPRDLAVLESGLVVVVGVVANESMGGSDGFISIHDPESGEAAWFDTFDRGPADIFNAVAPRPGGGFIVVGTTGPQAQPSQDSWLLALDDSGGIEWEVEVDGVPSLIESSQDQATDVVVTSAGEIFVLGLGANGPNEVEHATWVAPVSNDGELGPKLWAAADGSFPYTLAADDAGSVYASLKMTPEAGKAVDVVKRMGIQGADDDWLVEFSDPRKFPLLSGVAGGGVYWVGEDMETEVDAYAGRLDIEGGAAWELQSEYCNDARPSSPVAVPGASPGAGPAFLHSIIFYDGKVEIGTQTAIRALDSDGAELWLEPIPSDGSIDTSSEAYALVASSGQHAFVAGVTGDSENFDYFLSKIELN